MTLFVLSRGADVLEVERKKEHAVARMCLLLRYECSTLADVFLMSVRDAGRSDSEGGPLLKATLVFFQTRNAWDVGEWTYYCHYLVTQNTTHFDSSICLQQQHLHWQTGQMHSCTQFLFSANSLSSCFVLLSLANAPVLLGELPL